MSPRKGPRHSGEVTRLLHQARGGNREALDELLPLVYDELKQLAQHKLSFERVGHTLNATALVHEAYFKLVDQTQVEWQSRSHFFAIASQAMRRILIDYAKMRNAGRRGGGAPHVSIDAPDAQNAGEAFLTSDEAADLIVLDTALARLAEFNPRGAEVVQYRFFGGLQHGEIAEVLGIAEVTVRRSWVMAKTWLKRELGDDLSVRSSELLG